jgi:hypothetical protein
MRRRELDPINLVSRIMNEYPTAGVEEVCRRVRVALAGPDARYQDCFNDYCTINHYNLLYKDEIGSRVRRSRPRQTPIAALPAEQKVAAFEQKTNLAMETVKKIVIMEMPTAFLDSNGKPRPMGDLNETEGLQLTGWQASLYKGIGNSKLCEAKSEADLWAARNGWQLS